jgi:hypothetical protein
MRIILTIFAVALLTLPWLKIIGSLLLFWIGIKLLVPGGRRRDISASDNLLAAIKTILIADLVMSLDNVIAVAAAAGGSMTAADPRPGDLDSAGDLRRHAARHADGALPGDHHHRRRPHRLVAGEMLVTDRALEGLAERMGVQFEDGKPSVRRLEPRDLRGAIGAAIVVGRGRGSRSAASAKSAANWMSGQVTRIKVDRGSSRFRWRRRP